MDKVLVITNNVSTHSPTESLNKIDNNFEVVFLPTNVMAFLQRVIEKLERMYV